MHLLLLKEKKKTTFFSLFYSLFLTILTPYIRGKFVSIFNASSSILLDTWFMKFLTSHTLVSLPYSRIRFREL